MDDLRTIAMYKAANRTVIVFGAERELMLMLMIICFTLIFTGLSVLTTVLGIVGWIIGAMLLRKIAKKDPMMSKVFIRYWTNYSQAFFPASARPGATPYSGK